MNVNLILADDLSRTSVHFEWIRVEQMEHNGLRMTYRVEGNSKESSNE